MYSNWETREGLIWNFTWSGENVSAFASIMPDGTLLDFNSHQFDADPFGFAGISRDDAIETAIDFVARANPGAQEFFREPREVRTTLHSGSISVTFNAQVGEFFFPASQITVGINKDTGEISSYSTRNIDPTRFNFETVSSLIGEEAAAQSFASEIGLTLEYIRAFDSESDEMTIFPAYTFNHVEQRYISALTGEIVDFVFDTGVQRELQAFEEDSMAFFAPAAEMAGEDVRLSPAELEAIEQVAGFLTSEQALYRLFEVTQLTELMEESFSDRHISLERDWSDPERFIYRISLWRHIDWDEAGGQISSINGTVDAATGRVRSFNIGYNGMPSADPNNMMTENEVITAVGEFLEEIAPDEFARTIEDDMSSGIMPLNSEWASSGVLRFRYVRVENNALFRENGII